MLHFMLEKNSWLQKQLCAARGASPCM